MLIRIVCFEKLVVMTLILKAQQIYRASEVGS